jgi:hypothetical protein
MSGLPQAPESRSSVFRQRSQASLRIVLTIWSIATLSIASFFWLRTIEVEPVEGASTTTIHFRIAEFSAISVESEAHRSRADSVMLRTFVTLGCLILSAAMGNAIRLNYRRNLMQWLDGAAKVSVLGGFLMLGAGFISASRHFWPSNIQIHFFVSLFCFILVYGLMVLHLAAWRDTVEGKAGLAALLSRIGIEGIAWVAGLVGLLAVVGALAIKFLAIFVR